MKKTDKILDIRAAQLEQASPILQAALVELYDKYSLEICLTLMMWWTAKAILVANDLTDKERASILKECKESLDNCYLIIKNNLDTGEKE